MNTNLYEKVVNEKGEEIYKPYDINKTTICGKPLEEVIQILQALDLEKEYQMKLTLENLQKWFDLMLKQEQKVMDKWIEGIKK